MDGHPVRVALIEVGTNSTKLLVVRVEPTTTCHELHFSQRTTRIGDQLLNAGRIEGEGLSQTLGAIRRFQTAIRKYRCDHVFIFATYALRKATNAASVARRIEQEIGYPLRILTEREEAQFAYQSARHGLPLTKPLTVLVDIGGGSTEVVLADRSRVRFSRSTALGALLLTKRFVRSDPIAEEEFARLTRHVSQRWDRLFAGTELGRLRPSSFDLVASGGSVTTLANVLWHRTGGTEIDAEKVPPRIRSKDVGDFLERCLSVTLTERKRIAGLEPSRADILPAGLAIFDGFAARARKRVAHVNPGGVREGVLLHLLRHGLVWSL